LFVLLAVFLLAAFLVAFFFATFFFAVFLAIDCTSSSFETVPALRDPINVRYRRNLESLL
jgi:hypothetical protein